MVFRQALLETDGHLNHMVELASQWITKQIKYPGTLYAESPPHSWGHTNKSMRYQSRGRGLVQLNYWDAPWCLSFCQHGSKVRNGDEPQGVGRIMWVWWMWGCGSMWRPCLPPPNSPLTSLNVKCLTGRLSEEELQRAVAPLEPGGGRRGAEALAPRLSFCQCPHASITLSFCTAITGRFAAQGIKWPHGFTILTV